MLGVECFAQHLAHRKPQKVPAGGPGVRNSPSNASDVDSIPGQRTKIPHVRVQLLSRVWLCATLWTGAHQAPLSMGFPRQECWSGLLFPTPGDLPNLRIKPRSPGLQANSLLHEPPRKAPNTGVVSLSLLQRIFLIPFQH